MSYEEGARRLMSMLRASSGPPPAERDADCPCDVPMPAALVRCSLPPGHVGNHVANGVSGTFIAEWAPTS